MSRTDTLKEQIRDLDYHVGECVRKAKIAAQNGNDLSAENFDMLAEAGELELNKLFRDLADAAHEEAMISRREMLRDQLWARQG